MNESDEVERTDVPVGVRIGVLTDQALAASVRQKCAATLLAEAGIKTEAESWPIFQAVAYSEGLGDTLYEQVAEPRRWYVWIALVNNPDCPLGLLMRFAAFHSVLDEPAARTKENEKYAPIIAIAKAKLAGRNEDNLARQVAG